MSSEEQWPTPRPEYSKLRGTPSHLPSIQPKLTSRQGRTHADLWLDIPDLDILIPILQVPLGDGRWDASNLSNQAGYLVGTTYPTRAGNTAIAGHARLADGDPGPFCRLHELGLGDEINLLSTHKHYAYEVRLIRYVLPSHLFALRLRRRDWVTLLESNAHDAAIDVFSSRFSLQAVRTQFEEFSED